MLRSAEVVAPYDLMISSFSEYREWRFLRFDVKHVGRDDLGTPHFYTIAGG